LNILYPIFTLVAVTLTVAARLGYLRYLAVTQNKVDASFYEAYVGQEPLNLRIVSRHLVNLLELPLLFYVACLIAFTTGQNGRTVLVLAWSYVALRIVHTLIHLGPNVVIWRFRVFVLSVLALLALWAVLLLGLVTR